MLKNMDVWLFHLISSTIKVQVYNKQEICYRDM